MKDKLSWSRLAFLFPDRDVVLLGDFTLDQGYYFSNGTYKDYSIINRGGVETRRGTLPSENSIGFHQALSSTPKTHGRLQTREGFKLLSELPKGGPYRHLGPNKSIFTAFPYLKEKHKNPNKTITDLTERVCKYIDLKPNAIVLIPLAVSLPPIAIDEVPLATEKYPEAKE